MKSTAKTLVLLSAMLLGTVVVWLLQLPPVHSTNFAAPRTAQPASPPPPAAIEPSATHPPLEPPAPLAVAPAIAPRPVLSAPPSYTPAARPAPTITSSAAPANPPGKEPPRDPLARVALAYVGSDFGAELYWLGAINDPTLSGQERQDLIEDLNEDGISDPKHPTLEDLPVILRRLQLIELLGWNPMDRVNAEAFAEAYKDLVNLADVTVGNGELVK